MINKYKKSNPKPEFWVTNISNMNVSLADLNITIKAYTAVNLLDSKHYYITEEQLLKSAESGSLFKKRDKIYLRESAPQIQKINLPYIEEPVIPTRKRSVFKIEEQNYEELDLSDEQFAEENADLAEIDAQPIVVKRED